MEKLGIKITQASLNQTALDWPQNLANIYKAIDIAVDEGSDMVLMPELSLTGYEVNDDFQRTDNDRIFAALSSIAAYAKAQDPNLIVSVGAPWRVQLRDVFALATADPDLIKNPLYDRLNLPFNVQTLISGGSILSMTAKANLFRDERGYENRYFNEWSFKDAEQLAKLSGIESVYGTIPIQLPNGETIPFGRPVVFFLDRDGIGYVHAQAICEEKWTATQFDGYPHNDSRYERLNIIPSLPRYLDKTDGVLLEISNASPPSRLKQDKHMHLNEMASRYADIVVDTDGLGTSGASIAQFGHRLIAQDGKTISAGARMIFGQLATTTSIVHIEPADLVLEEKVHIKKRHDFRNAFNASTTRLAWKQGFSWDDPSNPDRWKEEMIRNLALWKFDYMRKSGSKGLANALSGGQDSAFNCVITRAMVELGMTDLGVEKFCDEMALPYKAKVMVAFGIAGHKAAVKECMNHMLTCYHMPTNNSSHETWYAAKTLIEGGVDDQGRKFEGIGGKFVERNVQDLVTMCAFIFGAKNSTAIPMARKMEIIEVLGDFVHASPHQYTPAQMQEWAAKIYKDYPEVEALTSAALPGHEIGYENFQARIRTVLIWAAANIERKMAEANPNLDEAYGAYATGAGDLHGGPINSNAGIHKADEQALLRYLEEKGLQGVMERVIALGPVNGNPPTAELQPKLDGKVVQFDEDALQGTFPQKAVLARLRHHTKIHTANGDRWMNAGELFDRARNDVSFAKLDDNKLFNAVAYFYQRWEGPAQHKIHFSPIAPTFGENVDKQTSLRTPNLSGGSRDEIVSLGIDLLHRWAKRDGLEWNKKDYDLLKLRAWQDKDFMMSFGVRLYNRNQSLPNMNYNLSALYDDLKEKGWNSIFKPATSFHPVSIVHRALRVS